MPRKTAGRKARVPIFVPPPAEAPAPAPAEEEEKPRWFKHAYMRWRETPLELRELTSPQEKLIEEVVWEEAEKVAAEVIEIAEEVVAAEAIVEKVVAEEAAEVAAEAIPLAVVERIVEEVVKVEVDKILTEPPSPFALDSQQPTPALPPAAPLYVAPPPPPAFSPPHRSPPTLSPPTLGVRRQPPPTPPPKWPERVQTPPTKFAPPAFSPTRTAARSRSLAHTKYMRKCTPTPAYRPSPSEQRWPPPPHHEKTPHAYPRSPLNVCKFELRLIEEPWGRPGSPGAPLVLGGPPSPFFSKRSPWSRALGCGRVRESGQKLIMSGL